MKCYHCSTEMTEQERDKYYEEARYCCNGHMCGCMGAPVDPPYCDSCIETGELATIGMALKLAFERLPYLGLVFVNPTEEGDTFTSVKELMDWFIKQKK